MLAIPTGAYAIRPYGKFVISGSLTTNEQILPAMERGSARMQRIYADLLKTVPGLSAEIRLNPDFSAFHCL
jgi:hypothetical protein